MKTKKAMSVIVFAVAFMSISAVMPGVVSAGQPRDLGVCKQIVEACEKAGFKNGGHKEGNHGLWIDCVGAIAQGKPVPGVTTVTPESAKTCAEAAKAEHKEHRDARKERRERRAEKKAEK